MQRWIVGGLVATMIFMGGSYYAYRIYKQNRPQPIWVPLPINPELPTAKRDEIIEDLQKKLSAPPILENVSRDLDLSPKMELPTDDAVAQNLRSRLFIKIGDMQTDYGNAPSIHIGMNGKAKENLLLGKIVMRLMDDVWPALGIDPPGTKKSD